jgi:hypothetical protein
MKSLLIKVIIAAIVITILAVGISHRSLDYNQAMAMVGKGTNVAMLIQGNKQKAGAEFMEALKKLRQEYEGSVKFIDVELTKRGAEVFFVNYAVNPPALVMFAPDGKWLGTVKDGEGISALQSGLSQAYGPAKTRQ